MSTAEIETLHFKIGQLVVAWDFLADALAEWLNTAERVAKNGAQGS